MSYMIRFACRSHIGLCRRMNQDNYLLDGRYRRIEGSEENASLNGRIKKLPALFGVFDGMGGEQRGETAAMLAAAEAAEAKIGKAPGAELTELCVKANRSICRYAEQNGIASMGTTAAMAAISRGRVIACNLGDSRIYRIRGGELKKLSVDHASCAIRGMKPPLYQYLGIPESEMLIEPHIYEEELIEGDTVLICSDGLTDMVPESRICEVISSLPAEKAADELIAESLLMGGRDNVTLILLRAEKKSFFSSDR